MATSRSASAAARLSRSAVAAFRASGAAHQVPRTPSASVQSIRSGIASAIVRPRALTSPNGNCINSSTLFSASCLNRVAARPYSSSSAQVPGTKAIRAVFCYIMEGVEVVLKDYANRSWISTTLRVYVILRTYDLAWLLLTSEDDVE